MHRPTIEHILNKFQVMYASITGLTIEDINEMCDSIRDEDSTRNATSKVLIKEIEKNLQELQKKIGEGQPLAEMNHVAVKRAYVGYP